MNDTLGFILFRFGLIYVELAIFILLFFFTCKKRKMWGVRLALALILVAGATIGLSFALYSIWQAAHFDANVTALTGAVVQLLILAMLSIGFYFCFSVSLYELGSIVSLGYVTRWIIFCLYSLLLNFIGPEFFLIRINQQTPLNIGIYVAVYLVYITFSAFMIHSRKKAQYTLELPSFIAVYVAIVLNTALLSFAETSSEEHLLEYSFVLLSNIITLAFIVIVNFYTQKQIATRLENEMFNSMLLKQTEQYKFHKANAETLHAKAHDLKHQVAVLRKGGPEAEKLLSELEGVVYGYESIILTDDPVLNIIISEKWQYCVKHKIKMTCNVDPQALKGLDNLHLYAMLGNILDNAIEAVTRIKEKERRIISLNIAHTHGVSILKCYNYFHGPIGFEDGLPFTSKEDKASHGFGVKSIKAIVEKYDGEMAFDIDDDIFNIIITIPDGVS